MTVERALLRWGVGSVGLDFDLLGIRRVGGIEKKSCLKDRPALFRRRTLPQDIGSQGVGTLQAPRRSRPSVRSIRPVPLNKKGGSCEPPWKNFAFQTG